LIHLRKLNHLLMKNFILIVSFFISNFACQAQKPEDKNKLTSGNKSLVTGAEQLSSYLPHIQHKRIGLVVNHTSLVNSVHLIDTLLALNVPIKKIFAPEHGFRGDKDAGETVKNDVDTKTGIPVVSLYGATKKPSVEQLNDIDIVIFDIQDVGVRFYTYISAMHYVMEACAENNKKMIVLDRPNPNGHYIDGPILQAKQKSYVGLHPIPIVHGLTVGELAKMINGENWLNNGIKSDLIVIPVKNYNHSTSYSLPVKPSPNLPNDLSIELYPSLCLFEGTPISVARGTYFPFQAIGYPDPAFGNFTFTPKSIDGMSKNPPHENKLCYGIDFRNISAPKGFTLKYVINYYNKYPNKDKFFNNFFDKLVGNEIIKQRIISGWTEKAIKNEWRKDLETYKVMREKYLLYPD
jgi:uncharacterized protein YbbC (DUF1343 family)